MKKILVTSALTCACSLAHAQSSVTLYGIVDATFAYVNNETSKIGTPGARTFQLSNGPQSASRWGLKIQEDLGGGNKVIAALENGFSAVNGAALQGGRMFGRQAWVGLTNPSYGTLTLGRQYEMGFDFVGEMTSARAFATQWGAHVGDSDNLYSSFRLNNSVKYLSPRYAGLQFGAAYGFSNQAGGDDGTGFANDRAYSFGLRFQQGPLKAAVAYTVLDNPSAGVSGNNPSGAIADTTTSTSIFYLSYVSKQAILNSAIRYSIGPVELGAVYSHVNLDYQDGSSLHLDNYEANATYQLTAPLKLGLAYIFTNGTGNGGASTRYIATGDKPKWHQFEAGAVYSLSKTTSVYLVGLYQKTGGDASVAALNVIGGPAGSNANRQVAVLTGLRHSF